MGRLRCLMTSNRRVREAHLKLQKKCKTDEHKCYNASKEIWQSIASFREF